MIEKLKLVDKQNAPKKGRPPKTPTFNLGEPARNPVVDKLVDAFIEQGP